MNRINELIERRKVLGPAYRLFYNEPFYPVRSDDVWLFDEQGEQFLDAYNNVPIVGHSNPNVVKAMSEQAATLSTHTRYLHHLILDYSDQLLSYFPSELNRLMLTCTGSEANDLAIRIAETVTSGQGIVVTRNAYHGVTHLLAQLSPSLAPISDFVRVIDPPKAHRNFELEKERLGREVKNAFDDLMAHNIKPCALLLDTIFASDGIYPAIKGVLDDAVKVTHEMGALVIIDEVQTGFARLGSDWWGFKSLGVEPDIVTMGKPMGNGYPIAGVVTKDELLQIFAEKGRYFNTFGGNPVAVAVGKAVLDELENKHLPQHVDEMGCYLQKAFTAQLSSLGIAEIRGQGLYWGLEVAGDGEETSEGRARRVVNHMRDAGVLLNYCGPNANVLKIRPPLTFQKEHADRLIFALVDALS